MLEGLSASTGKKMGNKNASSKGSVPRKSIKEGVADLIDFNAAFPLYGVSLKYLASLKVVSHWSLVIGC